MTDRAPSAHRQAPNRDLRNLAEHPEFAPLPVVVRVRQQQSNRLQPQSAVCKFSSHSSTHLTHTMCMAHKQPLQGYLFSESFVHAALRLNSNDTVYESLNPILFLPDCDITNPLALVRGSNAL